MSGPSIAHLRSALSASAATLLVAGFGNVTRAQQPPGAPDSRPAGQSTLEEVVVTAERREASVQNIPVAVTALTAEDLRSGDITSVEDLQYRVPGMYLGNAQGVTRITIRGIGMENFLGGTIGGDPGVMYHVDGVVYGRPQAASVDLVDAERVEVLRGPQGTLYGRNATGGAINVIAKRPTREFSTDGDVFLGERNTFRVRGAVAGPVFGSENVLARLAYFKEDADGFIDNVAANREDLADTNLQSARTSFLLTPSNNVEVYLSTDYSRRNQDQSQFQRSNARGGLTPGETLGGQLIQSLGTVAHDQDGDVTGTFWGATGQISWELAGMRFKSISAYRSTEEESFGDNDGTDAFFLNRGIRANESEQLTQEFQVLSSDSGPLQWLIGAFYFEERSDARQVLNFTPTRFAVPFISGGEIKTTSYAGFGQASYSITPRFRATAGLRYTRDTKEGSEFLQFLASSSAQLEETWKAVTPRATLEYSPTADALLYASAARGFKSGGFNIGALQGAPYEPEYVWSYEIGAKTRFLDDRVQANAAAFYYDYRDQQFSQILNVVAILTNAAASTIKGVELELRAVPFPRLEIDSNIAYVEATFDEFFSREDPFPELGVQDLSGNRLPRTPELALCLGAQYAAPLADAGTLTFRGEYSHTGKVFFSEFNRDYLAQDRYGLWNARIEYQRADGHLRFALVGKNLGNKLIINNSSVNSALLGFTRTTDLNQPRLIGAELGFAY